MTPKETARTRQGLRVTFIGFLLLYLRLRAPLFLIEPGVARGVFARVIRVEIDEAPLDLPVANFEHVAPASGAMLRNVGPPLPVPVLAVTCSLANDHVLA